MQRRYRRGSTVLASKGNLKSMRDDQLIVNNVKLERIRSIGCAAWHFQQPPGSSLAVAFLHPQHARKPRPPRQIIAAYLELARSLRRQLEVIRLTNTNHEPRGTQHRLHHREIGSVLSYGAPFDRHSVRENLEEHRRGWVDVDEADTIGAPCLHIDYRPSHSVQHEPRR